MMSQWVGGQISYNATLSLAAIFCSWIIPSNAWPAAVSIPRYGGKSIGRRYGVVRGLIWLDDVQCDGTEADIAQCQHSDWGINNCTHSDDVSISCIPGIVVTNNFISPRNGSKHKTKNAIMNAKNAKNVKKPIDLSLSTTCHFYAWYITS